MNKRAQAGSVLTVICMIIILSIILFVGLGEFLGTASDINNTVADVGYTGWFFSNWLTIIVFIFILYILYLTIR